MTRAAFGELSAVRVESPVAGPVRSYDVVEGLVLEAGPISGEVDRSSAGVHREPLIEIRVGDVDVSAVKAASCLLAPRSGDRVLVGRSGNDAFVLSVLVRGDEGASSIELGAGVAIEVGGEAGQERDVRVRGAKTLHLEASEAIHATTSEMRVNVRRASLIARKIEAIGASVESSFDHVRQLGRVVEVIAEEVSHRVKRSLRSVSELDQTRAGTIDTRAEGIIAIHGENTAVTARQIAKIDSNQIHIG